MAVREGDSGVRFPEIQRSDVASEAISTLKQMIIRGELTAGQRLPPERVLATQLGVSRPSLREAIRALTALNILESHHGHGTFVSSLDPELLAEPIGFVLQVSDSAMLALLEARCAIEAAVTALAGERASDLELVELEAFVETGVARLGDWDGFVSYDTEFHDRIRRVARSPILSSMMASMRELSLETRRRAVHAVPVQRKVVLDHRTIVKALKARDLRTARDTMVVHLERLLDVIAAGEFALAGSDGDAEAVANGEVRGRGQMA